MKIKISHSMLLSTLASFALLLLIPFASEAEQSSPKTNQPALQRIGVIELPGIEASSRETPGTTLSRGAMIATIQTLEDEHLSIGGGMPTYFIRYTAQGRLETFACPSSSVFTFYTNGSHKGVIGIGECPKDELLNKNFGAQQTKGFETALSAGGMDMVKFRKEFGDAAIDALKPETIQENGATFIHLTQLFFSGVGGVQDHGVFGGFESLLMVPDNSSSVLFIQSIPPNNCGGPFPICDDFRGTVREVARQVWAARSNPDPPRNFSLKPLRPDGRPTVCDSIAFTVAQALEQSDLRKIPVTETIRYKQHADQKDILEAMRKAASQRAQGEDISAVAMRIGEDCYHKVNAAK